MNRPDVKELFIYDRIPSRALEALRTNQIFCSLASSFNDPFDCAVPFEIDYDPVEIAAGWVRLGIKDKRSKKDILANLEGDLNDDGSLTDAAKTRINDQALRCQSENEKAGIICLTEDPASVLMWSHYGGKHQGVALGFTRDDGNQLGGDDVCLPVIYANDFPRPMFSEILHADMRLTNKLMSTKAIGWAYEKEWRIFYTEGGMKVDLPGPVCKIIVGCNAPQPLIDEFRVEAVRLGLSLLRAEKVGGRFDLEIRSI